MSTVIRVNLHVFSFYLKAQSTCLFLTTHVIYVHQIYSKWYQEFHEPPEIVKKSTINLAVFVLLFLCSR